MKLRTEMFSYCEQPEFGSLLLGLAMLGKICNDVRNSSKGKLVTLPGTKLWRSDPDGSESKGKYREYFCQTKLAFDVSAVCMLFGLISMIPSDGDAATVWYDNDYSSWNGSTYTVCDGTSGNGAAYGRYAWNESTSYRVDTSGNGTCNVLYLTPAPLKHKICQARPLGDPCSGYIYE